MNLFKKLLAIVAICTVALAPHFVKGATKHQQQAGGGGGMMGGMGGMGGGGAITMKDHPQTLYPDDYVLLKPLDVAAGYPVILTAASSVTRYNLETINDDPRAPIKGIWVYDSPLVVMRLTVDKSGITPKFALEVKTLSAQKAGDKKEYSISEMFKDSKSSTHSSASAQTRSPWGPAPSSSRSRSKSPWDTQRDGTDDDDEWEDQESRRDEQRYSQEIQVPGNRITTLSEDDTDFNSEFYLSSEYYGSSIKVTQDGQRTILKVTGREPVLISADRSMRETITLKPGVKYDLANLEKQLVRGQTDSRRYDQTSVFHPGRRPAPAPSRRQGTWTSQRSWGNPRAPGGRVTETVTQRSYGSAPQAQSRRYDLARGTRTVFQPQESRSAPRASRLRPRQSWETSSTSTGGRYSAETRTGPRRSPWMETHVEEEEY